MKTDCEYAIIGGGVAGLSMGISLGSLQKDFLIFEQSSMLQGIGAGFGLAANAMQAFEYLGLRSEVEQLGFYTSSYNILDQHGDILVSPYTQSISKQYNQKNFSVHRADLHLFLLSKLDANKILLGKRVYKTEQYTDYVQIFFEDGSTYTCRYLIVADGVKSSIRQQLIPNSIPRYSGYTCWRATIDNTRIQLQKGSETWGKDGRFGMTPLVGNRIYWYACINSKPNNPLFRDFKTKDLFNHFKHYHEPIPTLLENTKDEDLIWNDIIDIKPLSRFAFGRIVLIGDAAHATTPNMGQGACQALEDVVVLTDEIVKNSAITESFVRFEKRRLKRTKYIVETSWQIGKVSQWSNPILVSSRNILMKIIPSSWSQIRLKKLLGTDFMSI